jgi:hypothetical protein
MRSFAKTELEKQGPIKGSYHPHKTRPGENLLHDAHLIENDKDFHKKANTALERIAKRRGLKPKVLSNERTIWDIAQDKREWIQEELAFRSHERDLASLKWCEWAKKRIESLNEELSLFSTK